MQTVQTLSQTDVSSQNGVVALQSEIAKMLKQQEDDLNRQHLQEIELVCQIL